MFIARRQVPPVLESIFKFRTLTPNDGVYKKFHKKMSRAVANFSDEHSIMIAVD